MTTLALAIMKNPVLAETIRQNDRAALPADVLKAQRDAAIAALVKARRNKRRVRPLVKEVLSCVTALQMKQAREKQVVAECIRGIRERRTAVQLKAA